MALRVVTNSCKDTHTHRDTHTHVNMHTHTQRHTHMYTCTHSHTHYHRYLTDGLTTLPMGLLSRIVSTNDTLMALVPLLDQPPWVRRRCVWMCVYGEGG